MIHPFTDPTTDALNGSPTQDTSTRFRGDARLREKGFSIHARPKTGQPLWVRGGKVYTHSEALKAIGETT